MRSRWKGYRSPLARFIEAFLSIKRATGRRYFNEEQSLRLLDHYLLKRRVKRVADVSSLVLESFLISRPRCRPRSFNHLLGVVRRFLDWLVVQGHLRRSPLRVTPRRETSHRVPFLFEPKEAQRLLEISGGLSDNGGVPHRGATYRMIFALLYGLGLRVGEVSRLLHRDIDRERRLLVVRDSKFGKSRVVPFGPHMAEQLERYLKRRFRGETVTPDDPVFCVRRGRTIHPCTISQTFHALVPKLGLATRAGVAPPRLHDLRHSFAVRTLLRWYRDGVDPAARLLHLATFLGHVSPTSTAVYLTITRELLDAAGGRFEQFATPCIEVLR